ncbi:MAG: acetyltransferase [Tepidisphaeraceae bacterium]|jgi:UDP-perosamine 4-acetyltransferase
MDVLIIGAGGHGKVVLDILRSAGLHRPVGFLDAAPGLNGTSVGGLPVLGQVNLLPKLKSKARGAIVAVGDNRARASYCQLLRQEGYELVNALHPSATISAAARLGNNVVVAAGAVVGTDSELADAVIVNTSAIIDHECQIGLSAHICPAAALAGRVTVGELAFVGLGSRVIQCLSLGRQCVIGAGAVVIRDIPDFATAVGVPARIIKSTAPSPAEPCPV